jgi:hypothetical protein
VRIFGAALNRPASLDLEQVKSAVGTPEHADVADRIAAASVTLVKGSLVPVSQRPLIIATRMARRFGPSVDAQLRKALATIGWDNAEVLMIDPIPDGSQMRKAVEQARASRWVALLHFNRVESFDPESVSASPDLVELAAMVAKTEAPLTVVSLGSPYVLPRFGASSANLCTYSTTDATLLAVLRVLRGDGPARGTLPVTL